jgi:WD40 repeat protein
MNCILISRRKWWQIAYLFFAIILFFSLSVVSSQDVEIVDATEGVSRVVWRADGEYLAIGTTDGKVFIQDSTQQRVHILDDDGYTVIALAWDNPQNNVMSGHYDGTLRVWQSETGNLLEKHSISRSAIFTLPLQPNGNQVPMSTFDTFQVWDARTWTPISPDVAVSIGDVEWKSDGSEFAFAASSQIVGIASLDGDQFVSRFFEGHEAAPWAINWNTDDTLLLSAGGRDGSVRLWDVGRGEQIRVVLQTDQTITDAVFIDPAGSRAAAISESGTLYLLDTTTGQTLDTRVYDARLTSLAWNPVYDLLAVGGMIPADPISADPDAIPGFLAILPLAEWVGAG